MKARNLSLLLLAGSFFIFFMLIAGSDSSTTHSGSEEGQNLPEAVLRWKDKVTKEATKNEIPEAVPYLLGIIMAESGGNSEKYPDVMQCSESQGKPPNSIQDPNESIEVGIKYFADMWKGHREYDVLNIVQAYNFGGGFLSRSGKSYSLDRAIQFSKNQAGGKTVTYTNPIAVNLGYDYRYTYGNMFYAQIVKQYITSTSSNNSQENSAIVKSALKELDEGTHEGGMKYWQWYYFNGRVEWCAIFVSYNAEKAGVKMDRFAYCPTGIENFKAKNQWQGKGNLPKNGNIIFFDWDGDSVSDHVGIVEKVENEVVYTIEGNSGDKIAKLSYEKNSPYIMGYGTP
ncbi:TPA_asm: CHAP domain-containing protein [Listeria monocytogenes]|uniref:lysozyme family protein n=1 Tax=Listeria monocytogenes TaxID=1639 RepID=UPI00076673D0|nr:lysozyme family protein [Listeria monocytogenes]MBP8587238.1 CHAP domain-containing protein [Listeria monocytogenes]NVT90575.1 lysozyme family protein [Listeria monocytogenes]RJB63713.1 CHAP domain-containing protein [Listeria monocytogenes]CWU74539.1 CHAP domain [Listeria monocytogenes]CWW15610.1 CHAP domain [Listeria monocytogenes]